MNTTNDTFDAGTARAFALELPGFGSIAFGPFTRSTWEDGDGGEVVTWSSNVRDVNTNARGTFAAEERSGDLVGAAIDWSTGGRS